MYLEGLKKWLIAPSWKNQIITEHKKSPQTGATVQRVRRINARGFPASTKSPEHPVLIKPYNHNYHLRI